MAVYISEDYCHVYTEQISILYVPQSGLEKSLRNRSVVRVPKTSVSPCTWPSDTPWDERQLQERLHTSGEGGIRKGYLYYCFENNQMFQWLENSNRMELSGPRNTYIFITIQSVIMCYKIPNRKFRHDFGEELP